MRVSVKLMCSALLSFARLNEVLFLSLSLALFLSLSLSVPLPRPPSSPSRFSSSPFLTPPSCNNRCGVEKFVCTTLRPTRLPYSELYDYDGCAQFLSDYIVYEPLVEGPHGFPDAVCSPQFTLNHQRGDCFDMSILLVSYLLGAGYDAYVVCGTAPKWIALKDQLEIPHTECQ